MEGRVSGNTDVADVKEESLDFLVRQTIRSRNICDANWQALQHKIWSPSVFVAAGSFEAANAISYADKHTNTIIAEGRYFISNPDLPLRIKNGLPFTPYNRDTFYLMGPSHPEGFVAMPASPLLGHWADSFDAVTPTTWPPRLKRSP